jgi:hypothetical protein
MADNSNSFPENNKVLASRRLMPLVSAAGLGAAMLALTATTLLTAGAAWAADQQKSTPQQTLADKDFSKLSADGSRAFQDLTLTRLAIYDGRIDDAKKYVGEAETALGKARTDETVFTKAEADLKAPTANRKVSGAAPMQNIEGEKIPGVPNGMLAEMLDPKKPIAWLPIDGVITINEDFTASPAKTAAVAEANKSLKSGDRKGAIEKLKLADINVDVTLAVIPLEQTITNTHVAANLLNDGKYYEASQVLRQVQGHLRFDVTDISGKPSSK